MSQSNLLRTVLSTWLTLIVAAVCLLTSQVEAGQPDTPQQLADRIDAELAASWQAEGIEPAPVLTGRPALRRLTLDLAGRIPTVTELTTLAEDDQPEWRRRVVESLIASPDFAYHLRNELDLLLMSDQGDDQKFREYLLTAIQQSRGWDDMFADMVGVQASEETQGAQQFLVKRVKDVHRMTNDTSRLFFGVSINCAQCHDHPLVADWLQDHYYGLQAFFSRTYVTKKNLLAEKHSGKVKFTTTAGEEKHAQFMFLTGQSIDEPELERTDEERKKLDAEVQQAMKDDKAPAPTPPAFSPRSQLVTLALGDEQNRFLARSIVNRTWLRLFGRGLVDPPDQMHSGNPASHPELLDWLAEDLVTHDYDLRRLITGMVLSDAYLRSSVVAEQQDPIDSALFAVGKARVLTPRQYAASLLVASTAPSQFEQLSVPEKWAAHRKRLEDSSNGWASRFEKPGEHFQVGVDEALLMSNNDRIQNDLLRDGGDRLIGQLKELEPQAAVDLAFSAILSRAPEAAEREACLSYLSERQENQTEALQQVVWALLTSPELRFNH